MPTRRPLLGGVSGEQHGFIIARLLMPENTARCTRRLCTIYSLCGVLYLARTGGAPEMMENQAFKRFSHSWNKRENSSSVTR